MVNPLCLSNHFCTHSETLLAAGNLRDTLGVITKQAIFVLMCGVGFTAATIGCGVPVYAAGSFICSVISTGSSTGILASISSSFGAASVLLPIAKYALCIFATLGLSFYCLNTPLTAAQLILEARARDMILEKAAQSGSDSELTCSFNWSYTLLYKFLLPFNRMEVALARQPLSSYQFADSSCPKTTIAFKHTLSEAHVVRLDEDNPMHVETSELGSNSILYNALNELKEDPEFEELNKLITGLTRWRSLISD